MPQLPHFASSSSSSQRAVLRLVRLRVPLNGRGGATAAALPCHNYYDVYPEEVGPLGNIDISDAVELQKWLLVARRVTREEAEERGGCLRYTPSAQSTETTAEAEYYCITDTDDVVYGRASYLPHPPRRAREKRCSMSTTISVDSNTDNSNGGCTDEEVDSNGSA